MLEGAAWETRGVEGHLAASTVADDDELPADLGHGGRARGGLREAVVGGGGRGGSGAGRGEVVVVGSDDSQRRVFSHFQTPPDTAWGRAYVSPEARAWEDPGARHRPSWPEREGPDPAPVLRGVRSPGARCVARHGIRPGRCLRAALHCSALPLPDWDAVPALVRTARPLPPAAPSFSPSSSSSALATHSFPARPPLGHTPAQRPYRKTGLFRGHRCHRCAVNHLRLPS